MEKDKWVENKTKKKENKFISAFSQYIFNGETVPLEKNFCH